MSKFLNVLFGCWPHEWSWPISKVNGKRVPTYQVCVHCGTERPCEMFEAA